MAMPQDIEHALDVLQIGQRPLALIGQGMAYSGATDEVRAFLERTQMPFVRTPKGKGVMPDDHPLSAGAARTLALQQADVVFLMGARFNWILHFGLPPRYSPGRSGHPARHRAGVDAPEQAGRGGAARRRQGDHGAAQQALAGRQWFHPKGTRRGATRSPRNRPRTPR